MTRGIVDRRGQQVGDYLLERQLGRGGMSVVWLGRHVETGRPAAVKILNAGLPANIEADRRLTQEGRATQRIDHENVVKIYGWGQTADAQPQPFLALEYLEGLPLSALIGRGKTLPVERVVAIVLQALAALDKAHALDIIHRDIKPDNIFLVTRDGQQDFVKMLDFGIAKLIGAQPHTAVQTARGIVLGTPEYLPPEIALDQGIGPGSDLYALGVIMFEALTGRLPYNADKPMALAEAHCFAPIPRPRDFAPSISSGLERIIVRCLAKQPKDRYGRASELADELKALHTITTAAPTVVSAPLPSLPPGAADPAHPQASLDAVEHRLRAQLSELWRDQTLPGSVVRALARVDQLRCAIDELEADLALAGEGGALALDLTHEDGDFLGQELRLAEAEESEARALFDGLLARDARLREAIVALDGGAVLTLMALLDEGGLPGLLAPDALDRIGRRLRRHDELARLEEERARLQAEIESAEARVALARSQRVQLESDRLVAHALSEISEVRPRGQRRTLGVRREALRRTLGEALAQLGIDLALASGSRRG